MLPPPENLYRKFHEAVMRSTVHNSESNEYRRPICLEILAAPAVAECGSHSYGHMAHCALTSPSPVWTVGPKMTGMSFSLHRILAKPVSPRLDHPASGHMCSVLKRNQSVSPHKGLCVNVHLRLFVMAGSQRISNYPPIGDQQTGFPF